MSDFESVLSTNNILIIKTIKWLLIVIIAIFILLTASKRSSNDKSVEKMKVESTYKDVIQKTKSKKIIKNIKNRNEVKRNKSKEK